MSDHWNNLANLIGADVPEPEPTAEEPPSPRVDEESRSASSNDVTNDSPIETAEPASPTPEQAPKAEAIRPKPAPAETAERTQGPPPETPKPRNHWQKVAGALGLAFGKSDPKTESFEGEPAVTEADHAPVGDVDDRSGFEPAPSEQEPDTVESEIPAAEEKPSMFGFGWKSKAVDDTTASPPDSKSPSDAPPNAETLFSETPGDSGPEETYDKRHAERELAALFSDPVDTSIDGLEFTPSERPEEDSKPRYVDDVTVDDITFDEPLDAEEPSPRSHDPESARSREPDADDGEPRQGRRRRRGGRRRRRGDKQATSADDRSDVEKVESTSGASDPTAAAEIPTTSGAFGSGIMDQEDAMPLHEDVTPSDSGEERRSKRFRNIRSWKDTISTIVDANLAARGNSPTPRGANGGGGRRRRGGGGKRGSGRSRRSGGGAKPNGGGDS